MDEPLAVGGAKAFGYGAAHMQRFFLGEAALFLDVAFQAAAAHELHGDVEVPLVAADGVETDDVRVSDGGGEAGFALEAGHADAVLAVVAVEDLERHMALQGRVLGVEDAAHAAFAKLPDDGKVVELAAHAHRLAAVGAGDLAVGLEGRNVNDPLARRARAEVGLGFCLGVVHGSWRVVPQGTSSKLKVRCRILANGKIAGACSKLLRRS